MAEFAVGDKIHVAYNDELAMPGDGVIVEVWNSLEDVPEEYYGLYATGGDDYPTIVYVNDDDPEGTKWYGGADYITKIEEAN